MVNSVSRRASIAALVCLLLGGGALTAGALAATGKHKHSKIKKTAVTTTTSTTSTSTTSAPRGPNEDATHEAGESAAVEAQETATGRGGGGAFKPNEDATHEAGESAAREAQEDAGQRPTQP